MPVLVFVLAAIAVTYVVDPRLWGLRISADRMADCTQKLQATIGLRAAVESWQTGFNSLIVQHVQFFCQQMFHPSDVPSVAICLIWRRVVQLRDVHPCDMVPRCQVSRFQRPRCHTAVTESIFLSASRAEQAADETDRWRGTCAVPGNTWWRGNAFTLHWPRPLPLAPPLPHRHRWPRHQSACCQRGCRHDNHDINEIFTPCAIRPSVCLSSHRHFHCATS